MYFFIGSGYMSGCRHKVLRTPRQEAYLQFIPRVQHHAYSVADMTVATREPMISIY